MRNVVRHTADFDRIMALPRRVPTQHDAEAWSIAYTPELRLPWSKAVIRPWQAFSIAEIADAPFGRGAFIGQGVGAGKTLIMFMAPFVLEDVQRILYIVPASLVDKTEADFEELRKEWKDHKKLYVIKSREQLARDKCAEYLFEFEPDLIVIDESDEMSAIERSTPLKIDNYVWAEGYEHVRVVALTATPSRNSIMGYWHVMRWCLREGAPVPTTKYEAMELAAALDEKVRDPQSRPLPGPWGKTRAEALETYRRRILETPGVIIVDGDSCKAPLTVRARLAKEDSILDEHFSVFRQRRHNPDGITVTDPLSRWRMEGQLGCGLYSRYIKPPPEEWVEARREYAKFVREAIAHSQHSRKPLYSELMVRKRFKDHEIIQRWKEIGPTFDAKTETVWLSTSALESVLAWLEESPEPGIVWCGSVEFAQALSRAAKLRYYAGKGKSKDGTWLYDAPVENIIVSWNANKKGFNLQPWTRQLIVMPPQSAKWIEQIIGRSHRSGQEKHVFIDILMTSGGTFDLMASALGEAAFAQSTISLTQKMLRVTVQYAMPTITPSNEFRWASRKDNEDG